MTLEAMAKRVMDGLDLDNEFRKDVLLAVDPDYAGVPRDVVGGARRIFDSIDDAEALVYRALPGWWWEVHTTGMMPPRHFFLAKVYTAALKVGDPTNEYDIQSHSGCGNTAAQAIVAAILSARADDKSGEK